MPKEYIERGAILDAIAEGHGKRNDTQEGTAIEIWDEIKKIPAADVISRELFEQIKWERDIAMQQLEEHGIAFGEKKTADVVEVVRCRDCAHYCGFDHCKNGICDRDVVSKRAVYPTDFCSYGERKDEGE